MTKTKFGFFNTFLNKRVDVGFISDIMSDDEKEFNQESDHEKTQKKRQIGGEIDGEDDGEDEGEKYKNLRDLKRLNSKPGSAQYPILVLDADPTDWEPTDLVPMDIDVDVEEHVVEPPVVEPPVVKPPVEQQQPPEVLVLDGDVRQLLSSLSSLSYVKRLVVYLDYENHNRILEYLIRQLEKLGKGPRSHQMLSELVILAYQQLWNVQPRIKSILEMFAQLFRASSLLVGGDLLAGQYGSSFSFGKLSNLSIALGVWPGSPTNRTIRKQYQGLFEACGLTQERVQQSFLQRVSFVRMENGGQNEQFLDLSKPLLQDSSRFASAVVKPIDAIEYVGEQIIPHVDVINRKCRWRDIIRAHQDKFQLCDTLAHALRVNKERYAIFVKSQIVCILIFKGFLIPKNVMHLILCRLSLHDYKEPPKTSVSTKNIDNIITKTRDDPLVAELCRSWAAVDSLENEKKELQLQFEEWRRRLDRVHHQLHIAHQTIAQNEANAAEFLDQNSDQVILEVMIGKGEASRPRKTQEEKEAAKAAKAAKAAAKAASQTNGKKK